MKTFASVVLLATLVFISADARPREDDMIVEFAIGQSEQYSMVLVGELMEKYGKKLALVGRLISNIGDSVVGLGRWLQYRHGGQPIGSGDVRGSIAQMGQELAVQQFSSSEAYIASKIVAATFKQVAENKDLDDSQLEAYLTDSLAAVSGKMITASKGADVDEQKAEEGSIEIFERFFTSDF